MEIKEVTCLHDCTTKAAINTKALDTEVMDHTGEKLTLFKVMYILKQQLQCTFEFRLNDSQMDILLVAILPSGYALASFVIYCTGIEPSDRLDEHKYLAS